MLEPDEKIIPEKKKQGTKKQIVFVKPYTRLYTYNDNY